MGYFSDDDEKKIAKLRIENKNLALFVEYYSKRSKKYHDEKKVLKEEVNTLKKINEDLLKQISDSQHLKGGESIEDKEHNLITENTELKSKISDLEALIVKIQQTECVNEKNIFELELQIVEERSDFEKEKKEFAKKFSEVSRKSFEEKKTVELKCSELSQQVSDSEKVIILERDKFEKESRP
ncbi:hypothetical protein L6452_32648 [Arctium lappa]|uniref:Uncharacterized protein n=1 Tax=Arctium lappa TaxID=4217 RepID=A0ACB8Z572_ARCLA|nr:hypothetical protein L6452_32648 [Arctium lappa]